MRAQNSLSAAQAGEILAACAVGERAGLEGRLDSGLNAVLARLAKRRAKAGDSLEEERQEVVHAIAREVLSDDRNSSREKLEQAQLLRGILAGLADCSRGERARGTVPFYLQ